MRILYLLQIRTSGNNTTLAAISHIIKKNIVVYIDKGDFNFYYFHDMIDPETTNEYIILFYDQHHEHYGCILPKNNYNIFG